VALFSITDLDAGYETGQVLFDVTLEVADDEVVTLLGRNGAGKTTTMNAIMGADVPRVIDGSIVFRDQDLLTRPSYERSKLGISLVPEGRRTFGELTVVENLQLARNHAEDPLDVEEILSLFTELRDMQERPAKNMSGGEQQMLAIARSLITNPELMLLDEPCEGLAPYIVRRIESLIEEINAERDVSILLVEQNVAVALAVADRHYILEEGSIVDDVTTERLRDDEELRNQYLGV